MRIIAHAKIKTARSAPSAQLCASGFLPEVWVDTPLRRLLIAYEGPCCGDPSLASQWTDNGSCYKAFAFDRACKWLRLKHIRTRPYTPKTNGKAERFVQTALREWA